VADGDPQNWVRARLSGAQILPLRTRPWADVWRVDADDGRWWLKVNKAMTVYEPPLLAVLDRTGSALLAETLIHPDRPWSLIRDAGHSARDQHRGADQNTIVAFWCALMPAYADLQRATEVAALRAVGVPDLTPSTLVAHFDELLADRRWFTAEANPEIAPAEVAGIGASRTALQQAAAELATGVPSSIQHDDLHDGNVFLDTDATRVIDWGDAVIAHPFATLRVTLDVLATVLDLPPDSAPLLQVRDAYLEPWLVAGESRADLVRQCDLAIRTGGLIRAVGWARALGDPSAGAALGFSDGPSGWLQRLADDLRRPGVW
jgi:hypothetical protein